MNTNPAPGPPAGSPELLADDELAALTAHLETRLPAFLADLERLVSSDCGSYTKAGVDDVATWTAVALGRVGATVTRHATETLGDTLVGAIDGRSGGPHVLLIGHMDTVFPEGTAAERPFRIEEGIARGPGVTDMKSGLLAGLYTIDAMGS